jgi:WD40 repeat protein
VLVSLSHDCILGSLYPPISLTVFEEEEDPSNKSFFSEIIASISDVKFSPDGRYILARDYLTMKVWDVNMESRPVKVINIHDHLRSKLCDLYENDCIFDKFETAWSGDGSSLCTGSYHNRFSIYDWQVVRLHDHPWCPHSVLCVLYSYSSRYCVPCMYYVHGV